MPIFFLHASSLIITTTLERGYRCGHERAGRWALVQDRTKSSNPEDAKDTDRPRGWGERTGNPPDSSAPGLTWVPRKECSLVRPPVQSLVSSQPVSLAIHESPRGLLSLASSRLCSQEQFLASLKGPTLFCCSFSAHFFWWGQTSVWPEADSKALWRFPLAYLGSMPRDCYLRAVSPSGTSVALHRLRLPCPRPPAQHLSWEILRGST